MKRSLILVIAAASVLASCGMVETEAEAQGQAAPKPETVSSRPDATGGERLFVEHCASCHGALGMGTGLLGRRVQPAELEKREDLDASYVITAVRNGIGNMPMVPRGEVNDAELQAIAEYLAAGPHK